jgi:hypothetical protein
MFNPMLTKTQLVNVLEYSILGGRGLIITESSDKARNCVVKITHPSLTFDDNNNNKTCEFYTLHFRKNGKWLWRRNYYWKSYWGTQELLQNPLNMKRRKSQWKDYRPYNINDSEFDSIADAIQYMSKYLKRYKGI